MSEWPARRLVSPRRWSGQPPPDVGEALTLPAGRDLDWLVAERVLGWRPILRDGVRVGLCPPYIPLDSQQAQAYYYAETVDYFLPFYSTDVGAAWLIVDWLQRRSYSRVDLTATRSPVDDGLAWTCRLFDVNHSVAADGPSAPLALCRAALALASGLA